MSASTLVLPQATPAQLARGIAGAVPGELSKSPLLGILGVIIGAGVVTLTSRMISLGLPDFKGHRGFGYDESAWMGTAFDAGLMFIGPFIVYLGGLIAPRRILLTAATLFTLLSIFLPLIHNYALVIVAVGLAGLTSGTFYPLTLTFALRNIPLRYLPFTIAMPYLRQWNTILLGTGLFFFRFFLVTTIILIPQSLAIRGFEPDQIGPAVIWTAASFLPLAFVAGVLHASNADPRLLLATGFAGMAFASFLNARLTSAWAAPDFYRTEFLMGFGQCFAFIGLVSAIILQGLFSGGLLKPQRILTFSAFFHTVRIFGGTIGAILMGRFIAEREKFHSNLLGLHVQQGNWITDASIRQLTAGLSAKSSGLAHATGRAVDVVGARLGLQAYTLSVIEGFYLVAWAYVIALFLVALLRESPLKYGDLSAIQQHPATAKGEK